MITNEQAQTLAKASNKSYDKDPVWDGYTAAKQFNDPNAGFQAAVFQKNGTNEFIVAFAGTSHPLDMQDNAANIALGKPQWNNNKEDVLSCIDSLDATKIDFTGHSLGGALAQYAAYEYASRTQNNPDAPSISMVTFNGVFDETGNDTIYVGTGNDFVYAAGAGNDTVFG